jgi:ATP-dependent Clp protease ATP-binding subunit ClpA
MKLNVPLYCEKQPGENKAPVSYLVRPLFFTEPEQRREDLSRAITALNARLREELQSLAAQPWHEVLAEWAFAPALREDKVEITLDFRKRTAKSDFLIVSYEHENLRIAFTPKLPDLFFSVRRGETIEARARDVLQRYFKKLEREEGEDAPDPREFSIKGQAWLSTMEIRVETDSVYKPPAQQQQAARGEFQFKGGLAELQKTGRNLDALYPDEIDRAVQCEAEVTELAKAIDAPDFRPALLLGPRGCGKSAILHEYVARTCEARRKGAVSQQGVWLLNPQRLISGMSYVGQWENRLHAIIAIAKERKFVLAFDDLVGLFKAGQTSQSRLSVAHLLKPYIEKRELRVIGEATPEQFRVLQELDRGFADLFHVIPVREPSEDGNLSILIEVMRRLEAQHECRFSPDVIPTVVDLQARYVRDSAFPGKAAGFMRQLAARYRRKEIGRSETLDEFKAVSGLSVAFLDERIRLERATITDALKQDVIGQDHAVNLLADTVMLAKARLNDQGRPLGSFLFLGPTGVGKTQMAKSIAKTLFGDEARLVRFDMNEFVSGHAVSRLTGSFNEPEGLLTGAIRRQPFCVLLFDEIEKCHPDAYDLLLQVLGEARLTDALGRTADFSNTIIILTSNLGVREADGGVGFKGHDERGAPAYVKAAERFFRPEFFNRLDHIVPFGRLPRNEVEKIVHVLIRNVFAREGLSRRKCVLRIEREALKRVVDEGYHPKLGARALKRAIERLVTRPLSASLARLKPDVPTLITLAVHGDSVRAQLKPFVDAMPPGGSVAALGELDAKEALALMDAALEEANAALEELRPKGTISGSSIEPKHRAYFAIKAQAEKVGKIADRIERGIDDDTKERVRKSARAGRSRRDRLEYAGRRAWGEFCSASDLREFLEQAALDRAEGDAGATYMSPLQEAALLRLLVRKHDKRESRWLLHMEALNGALASPAPIVAANELALFKEAFDLEASEVETGQPRSRALVLSGALADEWVPREAGVHLFVIEGELAPVAVSAIKLKPGEKPERALKRLPDEVGQVVRVHHGNGLCMDLRSGVVTRTEPGIGARRSFMLSLLPIGDDEEE